MGFEPTRAEHIGLAVQRLNHSATSSDIFMWEKTSYQLILGPKINIVVTNEHIFRIIRVSFSNYNETSERIFFQNIRNQTEGPNELK